MVEDITGRPRVVAGGTRQQAAEAFGVVVDDALVTSYDDLATEADLGDLEFLALAADPAQGDVLRAVLESDPLPGRLLVEVGKDAEQRRDLVALFEAHPETGIIGTMVLPFGAAVEIGPASDVAAIGAVTDVVLDALANLTRADAALWPEPGAPILTDGSKPEAVTAKAQTKRKSATAKKPTAAPAAPVGSRRRSFAIGGAVAALAALTALGVVASSDLGVSDAVVVALLLALGLGQAATLVGIAYLVWTLRRSQRASAAFEDTVLYRTRRLMAQGTGNRKRLERQGRRQLALGKTLGRQQAHHEYIVELGRGINRQFAQAQTNAIRRHLITERQAQALLNLHDLVEVKAGVPPAGGWAASPDLLLFCVDTLLARRPMTVVECGSGVSTLYLALAVEQYGLDTKIIALEHQEGYAVATRELLDRHGVGRHVDVRIAPLERTSIADHGTPWYAESALEGISEVGMLLVDGPPSATGSQARYPAVPLLADRLSAACVIVLDDLIQESGRQTAQSWAEQLPDFDLSVRTEFDKHVGILRRG